MANGRFLFSGFLKAASIFHDRPAVVAGGTTLTYGQLLTSAQRIAATIRNRSLDHEPKLTAVYAYRSPTAFAGVLGALLAGHGYVPLNRTFPTDRTRVMLQRAGCSSMIVDQESADQLKTVLQGIEEPLLLIFPDQSDSEDMRIKWHPHIAVGRETLEPAGEWRHPSVMGDDIAYLLFTSGSTGIPKGVMVAHRNVSHYINFIADRLSITHEDRFSQNFDMTFDLSVADMFVAWERGACVCCPSEKTLLNPGRFINDARLSVWFSVPSTAVFMKRLGSLKAGSYPGLRVSMFCGEALPVEVAKAWAEAAPGSILENIYGPTELTIACAYYRWDPVISPSESALGVVPIGDPFPGMVPLVVDETLNEVGPGEDGELLMMGPQLSLGYWRDPEKTAAAFVVPPGKENIYYRTGDRVRKPIGGKPMTYLGRVDNQIKIFGHRVELGEIEAVLREESGIDAVVAVGWPVTASGASGVEAFVQTENIDLILLQSRIRRRLPSYMVPRRIHLVETFPLNVNGKYDRKELVKLLEKDDERV